MYICFIYIYIYIYTHTHVHIHVHIHTLLMPMPHAQDTVNFHNFKSQNFKLSVSNPKSKDVAYVSVLSQISNCRGLGRKNKFEILKTYRMANHPSISCNYMYHMMHIIT